MRSLTDGRRPGRVATRRMASAGSHPAAPGEEPRWATAAKDGVGTARCPAANSTSLVWFTLGRGILTEIFYPRVDQACTRDLGLIVTDGHGFFSDECRDAEHRIEYPVTGVPLYRLINTCRQGRYRIEKTVFAHPHQDAVLQVTRFDAVQERDCRLSSLRGSGPPPGEPGARKHGLAGRAPRRADAVRPPRPSLPGPGVLRLPGSPAPSGTWEPPTAGKTCRGKSAHMGI